MPRLLQKIVVVLLLSSHPRPPHPPFEHLATETGIKQRPIVSKPISSKPVGGKGSRFDVLSEQMVEESDAIMEGKFLKGKDHLTTSGEPEFHYKRACSDFWLRLSGLPIEWVDAGFLWKLGGILGKTCRVDQITEAQSRGRYARLCIEIDISKHLRSYMKVDGKIIRIEYENLNISADQEVIQGLDIRAPYRSLCSL
ncbi:hypothetical protein JRO89_XS09G0033700 [Xanthoceras sorbifolium]|uniref:Uncharacterized protein n=1 Tax=Xanthoceras sorbifolium TaxID=99658 RepID=A0ABQ8HKH7_9ROSI|nr:hypothetical protein JRO89_XS09G0033700 [Xanthoceras sorbifolium]